MATMLAAVLVKALASDPLPLRRGPERREAGPDPVGALLAGVGVSGARELGGGLPVGGAANTADWPFKQNPWMSG